MSDIKCDFCQSTDYEILYKPIGTKRDVDVAICNNCHLVFSIVKNIPYSRKPNPSGDADWGNVRFCKGQRFDALKEILPVSAGRVLDVGSSRGHFVRWMKEQNPKANITALEPDTRVCGDYAFEFKVIGKKLEDVTLFQNYFDFVYCCQTLEHVDSAASMLRQIYMALKPGGTVLVEVPNIEVISYPLNIEEFFIDKHNFHFSKKVLCAFMESIGYRVTVNDDNLNVRIFATKEKPGRVEVPETDSRALIKNYAKTIEKNRGKLPGVVSKIEKITDKMKSAFWGANTMFDLMVKYGGLDPLKVECLVDQYMHQCIETIHGVRIQDPQYLRVFQPNACFVLARFSSDEIVRKARRWNIRNVIKFSDLLESC